MALAQAPTQVVVAQAPTQVVVLAQASTPVLVLEVRHNQSVVSGAQGIRCKSQPPRCDRGSTRSYCVRKPALVGRNRFIAPFRPHPEPEIGF